MCTPSEVMEGDLAADMKLELRDWRDASSIEKMTAASSSDY